MEILKVLEHIMALFLFISASSYLIWMIWKDFKESRKK
jgi:hypothetical protein